METYFTIKLWTEFYIPFLIISGFIILSVLAIAIAAIGSAFEKRFKNKMTKESEREENDD